MFHLRPGDSVDSEEPSSVRATDGWVAAARQAAIAAAVGSTCRAGGAFRPRTAQNVTASHVSPAPDQNVVGCGWPCDLIGLGHSLGQLHFEALHVLHAQPIHLAGIPGTDSRVEAATEKAPAVWRPRERVDFAASVTTNSELVPVDRLKHRAQCNRPQLDSLVT